MPINITIRIRSSDDENDNKCKVHRKKKMIVIKSSVQLSFIHFGNYPLVSPYIVVFNILRR